MLADEQARCCSPSITATRPSIPTPPLDDAAGLGLSRLCLLHHGTDLERFVFAGDSAGANLALALMLRLRDAGRSMPTGGALLYGCFAPGLDTMSARTFGTGGYGLTSERMAWYLSNYPGGSDAVAAMPLHGVPAGHPPLSLVLSEADILASAPRSLRDSLAPAWVGS